MRILRHNDVGSGSESTVDKFVVVRVGYNHTKPEMWVYITDVVLIEYK